MQYRSILPLSGFLFAAALLVTAEPSYAQRVATGAQSGASYEARLAAYTRARNAYEAEASAYWNLIADKRRVRFAKRRNHEPVGLDDYVLTQPPVYTGPPRPADLDRDPTKPPREPIPVVADFLKAAADHYRFVPQRPGSDLDFKRAYASAAKAAGLTRDQVVRIYAFETGGNGTYDVQSGLTHPRPNARAISTAVGYNQLLTTNSVSLLAGYGDQFVQALRQQDTTENKVNHLRRMIAFSRTVPNQWGEHDKLAKTRGGLGIHAAVLDRDFGPLLQVQKLLTSVRFAQTKGHTARLTAAELEMMNLTGDGNGIDLVTMPQALRERVPTSNFFQRGGYERNGIARRTGTVAGLYTEMNSIMDRLSQQPGAKELASVF
jgi:hypothetical protein